MAPGIFSMPIDELFEPPYPPEVATLLPLAGKDPALFLEKVETLVHLPLLAAIVENHPEMIYVKDRSGRMLYVNEAYMRAYGKARDYLIGKTDGQLFSPDHFERTCKEDLDVMRTKVSRSFEGVELWPDGKLHYVKSTRSPLIIPFPAGDLTVGTFGVCDDLTFTKERAIFNSVPSGIVTLRPERKGGIPSFTVIDINESAQNIGKTTREASYRQPIEEVLPQIGHAGILDLLQAVDRGLPLVGTALERFVKPFKFFVGQEEMWWSGVFAQKLSEEEILLVFNDETKNRIYDQLTGVKNEESFKETVARLLGKAGQTAIISMGIKDLDDIRVIRGLAARNDLIRDVATLLGGIVATLPGAELARGIDGLFYIYAGPEKSIRTVNELTGRIAAAMDASPWAPAWAQGIALYPSDGEAIEELMQKSIIAFGNAKPKSVVGYDQEMFERLLEASVRKGEILGAIANKEFFGVVQPLVSRSGRIAKGEYLIRWKKGGQVVSPGLFIKQAQDANLMVELGELVLHNACRAIRTWEDAGLRDFSLSVNVDPRQVSEKLVALVSACLDRYGLDPDHLCLEITEAGFDQGSGDDDGLQDRQLSGFGSIIQEIRDRLKVKISIDDFGKENSSLSRLQYLPADIIKIDKLFADRLLRDDPERGGIAIDPFGVAVYQAIVNFAKIIKAEVVAEGVEYLEQYRILDDLGINHYQGYLFFKPMALDAFQELLSRCSEYDLSSLGKRG